MGKIAYEQDAVKTVPANRGECFMPNSVIPFVNVCSKAFTHPNCDVRFVFWSDIEGLTPAVDFFEVDRTASNSIELEHPKKRGNNCKKRMNYEEWSKSIELDRTLTPHFVAPKGGRAEEKILEQKVRKETK